MSDSSTAPRRDAGQRPARRRLALALLAAHVLGAVSSVHALMSTRTAQGSIAWIVSLNTLPVVAVPAYWVFGRTKFQGYVTLRRELARAHDGEVAAIRQRVEPFVLDLGTHGEAMAGAGLAELPYLRGNAVELLVDGEATFASILAGIDAARDFVLVQFYIVRDDGLGRELRDRLIARARDGVRVWFLYDEVGSKGLSGEYGRALAEAGVAFRPFHSTRGSGNRFQLNFRNHRKIVVVDGSVGWVGGHNVGDEYLAAPAWRDTHVRIEGPAALELQVSFVEDWRWATDETLDLAWEPHAAADGDATVLIVPSGPADRLETASLMFQQAIHTARTRIWIASPYFVPDEAVLAALHLARLRGVEVRVVIPDEPDSLLVAYSTWAFVGPLLESGVEFWRYEPGFLHEKVFLVDDLLAGVGTANFDNRSFRLNFEVTALVVDRAFAAAVQGMFEADLARSRAMTLDEVRARPWWFRALARAAYLTAPIQ
jgi:cardiolipin synthase